MHRALSVLAMISTVPVVSADGVVQAPRCNIYCIDSVSGSAVTPATVTAARDNLAPGALLTGGTYAVQKTYDSILMEYKNQVQLRDTAVAATRVTGASVGVVADLSGELGGPIVKIVTSTAGAAIDLGAQVAEDKIVEFTDKNSRTLLTGILLEIKSKDETFLNSLQGLTPEQRSIQILARQGTLLDDDFWNMIDPAHRDAFLRQATTTLFDEVITIVQTMGVVDAEQSQKIAQASADLRDANTAFSQFRQETTDKLVSFSNGQRALFSAVRTIETTVSLNTRDIDVLQQVAFGQLSPKQQADALEKGFFSRLPADKLEQVKRQVQEAAARQELDETITSSFRAAGGVIRLASALKVDSEIVSSAQTALGVASGVYKIAKSWGNPIAMMEAAGVLGDVFGGGSDGGAAQNAAIMAELGAIRQQLQELSEQVDTVRREMHAEFSKLREDLDRKHEEVLLRQTDLLDAVARNTGLLLEGLTDDLRQCIFFEKDWNEAIENAISRSQVVETFNQSLSVEFGRCVKGLSDRTQPVDGAVSLQTFQWAAFLPATATPGVGKLSLGDFNDFNRIQFQPTFRWHQKHAPFRAPGGSFDEVTVALLAQPFDSIDMVKAYANDSKVRAKAIASANKRYVLSDAAPLLREFLYGAQISAYARRLKLVTGLYDQLDRWDISSPKLLGSDVIQARSSFPNNRAQTQTKAYMVAVDAAAAQERMVAGVYMSDWLVEKVEQGLALAPEKVPAPADPNKSCEPGAGVPEYAEALCFLKNNKLLAYNFSIAWVRHRLKNVTKLTPFQYYLASELKTCDQTQSYMKWAIGNLDVFCKIGATGSPIWFQRLPAAGGTTIEIPLPNHSDVERARFYLRPTYREVVEAQKLLREHLGSISVVEKLSESDRQLLFSAYLYSNDTSLAAQR